MSYCPIAFITGQTGKNMKALLNHAQMLYKQTQMRVSTANINKLLKAASIQQQPPLFMNRRPKIYFGSQIAISPPTIIMMCNMPQGFPPSYRRYLLNVFREHLPFGEVPIKMYLQKRDSEGGMSRRRTTARTGDELENEIPESDFIDDAEMDSWDDEGEATELDFLGDDQSQPGQPQEGN
jgi:GTPase